MTAILFKCPRTGQLVNGWVAEEPSKTRAEEHEPVRCNACRQIHLINRETGKALGQD